MGKKTRFRNQRGGMSRFLTFFPLALAAAAPAIAQDNPASTVSPQAVVGVSAVLLVMAVLVSLILTTTRLKGSSLFNRLFIIVAVTSGFFSAVSSAIGFGLITSQESDDLFRNSLLPPAFGVFVFFLAVAIWVGGAEFVRNKDWFRGFGGGFLSDMLFFLERCLKLFVVIPILAVVLFFVSTWTTVVGIGGVDAVRHTYQFELDRLQAECVGITTYRQADLLVLRDLQLSVDDVDRVATAEAEAGSRSGSVGQGAVNAYFLGIAEWYKGLVRNVEEIVDQDADPAGVSPYEPQICQKRTDELRRLLAENAFDNYDAWASRFEREFDDFASILNRWRHDRRVEDLLDQQLDSFDRANPRPTSNARMRVFPSQTAAMEEYAELVTGSLDSLVRSRKLAKPNPPLKSAAEISPERGLDIFRSWFAEPEPVVEPERVSRTASVVASEFIPGLSVISPRDAVLKNANIFSDIWALAISWDYAAYILMFAFLFFPSAERAARYKDE